MKKKELFDRTISILVKAYFENTLTALNPCGCAVGNLVAANCGFKITHSENNTLEWETPNGKVTDPYWNSFVHNTGDFYDADEFANVWSKQKRDIALSDLHATGYTEYETFEIEKAFEGCNVGNPYMIGDRILNALMRVVDYLMTIHEATETEISEAKQLFVKV